MDFTEEHLQRLVAVEQSSKSAHHRIDDLEDQHEVLHQLATSVGVLTERLGHVQESTTDISDRLAIIESKPAKRLDAIWAAVIGVLVSGVVGFFIGQILK